MSTIFQLLSQAFLFVCCQLPFFGYATHTAQRYLENLKWGCWRSRLFACSEAWERERTLWFPGECWHGLCSSSRRHGLPLLHASAKKKGLELDNISFRKFLLKKTYWKTKVLEMLSLFFFSGSFVSSCFRSCMKFQQGLHATEHWNFWNKEVLIKLFADIFINHQRQIEIWFYKEGVFSYPSCILLVLSSLSQALAALCFPQW